MRKTLRRSSKTSSRKMLRISLNTSRTWFLKKARGSIMLRCLFLMTSYRKRRSISPLESRSLRICSKRKKMRFWRSENTSSKLTRSLSPPKNLDSSELCTPMSNVEWKYAAYQWP